MVKRIVSGRIESTFQRTRHQLGSRLDSVFQPRRPQHWEFLARRNGLGSGGARPDVGLASRVELRDEFMGWDEEGWED